MAGLEKAGVQLIAENAAGFFGDMSKASIAVNQFSGDVTGAAQKTSGAGEIMTGALRQVGTLAVNAFLEAGRAAVGFVGDSISAAGDFESGMNKFAAVAGGALEESGLKLKDFRDQFIQIGKELPVSTAEVQQAAIEMVKGGIEPATIAAGGLKQVIQFAAAADLDLAEASTIAAKAIGGWVDQAASAEEKADFLAHSTDLLAKAANASTVNVDDLALGLYNVQGTAKLAGVSFDETVTTLAQLAPAFSSSSDAGTSFKTFLSRLQPTTKPATEAMRALNLVTKDGKSVFYDAQGNFVGMAKASELLHNATKDLTEEQRVNLLQTIFGQDAIRTAAILAEQGADGFNNMTAALEKQNSVQEMAKQKQAGFNTALDNFKGSAEALQITIGSILLPILTTLFNDYLAPGVNILTDLAGAFSGDADALARLSPFLQDVVAGIGMLMSGSGSLSDLWTNTFLPAITVVSDYFTQNLLPILENLGAIALPLLGAALQVLSGFWSDVLVPALTFAWDVINTLIIPILTDVTGWLAEVLPPAIQATADFLTGTLFPAFHDVYDFLDANVIPILSDVVDWLRDNVPPAVQKTTDFWNEKLWPALEAVWKFIDTKVIPIIQTVTGTTFPALNEKTQAVANFWNNTLKPALEAVWRFIDTKIIPLIEALANVAFALLSKATEEYTGLLNEGLLPGFEKISDFVNEHLIPDMTNVKDGFKIVSDFIDATMGPTLTSFGNDVLGGIVGWFGQISSGIDVLIGWLNTLAEKIRNLPSLPSPWVGTSPPPIAQWMGYISDATAQATRELSALGATVRVMPAANPSALLARGGALANATYNQQRTTNLTYHTTHAPPVNQSLAIVSALAGGS